MKQPTLYKSYVRDIVHLVQTNESVHLSDKSRYDIESRVQTAVVAEAEHALERSEYWERFASDLIRKRFPLKWNELRLKLARITHDMPEELTPAQVIEFVLVLMHRLDDEQYIRDAKWGEKTDEADFIIANHFDSSFTSTR